MRDGALKGASKGIPDTKCRVASWLLLASTFAIFAVILSRNYWPDQPYLSDTSLNATNSALSSQAAASGSETSPSRKCYFKNRKKGSDFNFLLGEKVTSEKVQV